MKYLRIIFYPIIWLISLPNRVRVLERRIETLSERLEHYETSTDKDFERLSKTILLTGNSVSNNMHKIKKHEKALNSINVSADVCVKSPSWCVLSYKGNKGAIVKFYDLDRNSIKEIQRFLDSFESTNRHIDAPRFFKS